MAGPTGGLVPVEIDLIVEHRLIDKERTKTFAAAAELIRSKVDVLVVSGPEVSLKAAIAASHTIPIVMIASDYDPIAHGCEEPRAPEWQYHRAVQSPARIGPQAARIFRGSLP